MIVIITPHCYDDSMKKVNYSKRIFYIYAILLFLFVVIKINDDIGSRIGTVMQGRQWGYLHINLVPFSTIEAQLWMISNGVFARNAILNLAGNTIAFIPLGFFIPILYKKLTKFKYALPTYFVIIFSIETFQHLSALGYFDVDDIILNVLGCSIGYLVFYFIKKRKTTTLI